MTVFDAVRIGQEAFAAQRTAFREGLFKVLLRFSPWRDVPIVLPKPIPFCDFPDSTQTIVPAYDGNPLYYWVGEYSGQPIFPLSPCRSNLLN